MFAEHFAPSSTDEVGEVVEEDAPVVDESPVLLDNVVIVKPPSTREDDGCIECVLGLPHGTDGSER